MISDESVTRIACGDDLVCKQDVNLCIYDDLSKSSLRFMMTQHLEESVASHPDYRLRSIVLYDEHLMNVDTAVNIDMLLINILESLLFCSNQG